MGECPERQRGRTVNPLAYAFVGSSPTSPTSAWPPTPVGSGEGAGIALPTSHAHAAVVDMVKYSLGFYGHEIVEETYDITPDGARFFGVLSLRGEYGAYTAKSACGQPRQAVPHRHQLRQSRLRVRQPGLQRRSHHQTLLSSSEKLAWVSTETREEHRLPKSRRIPLQKRAPVLHAACDCRCEISLGHVRSCR